MSTKHRFALVVLPAAVIVVAVLVVLLRPSGPEAPVPSVGEARDPNVVARISQYVITRAELEKRLVQEIRPQEEEYLEPREPVTAETVLRKMIAEKAMSLEGRRLGYLKDEIIHTSITQFEHQRLVSLLVENVLRERAAAVDTQAQAKLKEDAKLTPDQARMLAQRQTLEQFYQALLEKFDVKKLDSNFMQAALVHQRLLHRPVEQRGPNEFWIKNSQVRNELSEKEKNLVLATYTGGQFTLKEWFQAVCNIAPPRRPSDLNTPAGVARLLEGALRVPILVAEARARGYDKDQKLRDDVRQYEDQHLLSKVQEEKTKAAGEPTAEQIQAYFEKNKERFAQAPTAKVDQIWCPDLPTAEKLKMTLAEGQAFETVRAAHSLQKDSTPYHVYPGGEGLFWDELWKGEPNQVLGPLRGFYGAGVKWRLVKILEKKPAQAQPFSEQLANDVKWAMIGERRRQLLDNYQRELLGQYPYEVLKDQIKDMDPLEIAMKQGD